MPRKKGTSQLSAQEKRILARERKLKEEEERLLAIERRIQAQEKKILQEEELILKEGKKIEKQEEKLLEKEVRVREIEEDIENQVTDLPLHHLTMRDIYKAMIGAFFGVVAHFSFAKGAEVAYKISMGRATLMFIVAYLLGYLLIDKSGFRKVKEPRWLKFIPVRVTVIFLVSIAVILTIFFIFDKLYLDPAKWYIAYKQVAVTSILAMMGAATANMIGHHHHE